MLDRPKHKIEIHIGKFINMATKYIKCASAKHYLERRAGVICICGDKMLFIKGYEQEIRGTLVKPLWGFPKGSLYPNEKYEDCAVRELHEETGICVKISADTKSIKIARDKCDEIMILYIVEFPKIPDVIPNEEEISQYAWYSIDELASDQCTRPTVIAIAELQKMPKYSVAVDTPDIGKIFGKTMECKHGDS